jgi:SAM-dependent methyltransferase
VIPLGQVLATARRRAGALRRRLRRNEGMDRTFGRFYARNLWRGEESVSGPGSSVATTATVRAELSGLVREFSIGSVLDIPCGDFNWMKEVPLDGVEYIGADIVSAMIEEDRRRHAGPNRSFLVLDAASSDLPRVDLILCRDLLVHLSEKDIRRALENFQRSGSRFLLATTFPEHRVNEDITTGEWRELNLQRPPFSFPEPLRMITERSTPSHPDKALALWELRDL